MSTQGVAVGMLPPTFEPDYINNAVMPDETG